MSRRIDRVPSIRQESRTYFRALGVLIAQLRKEHGLTQAELARALGVSQQTVFAYELGDRRVTIFILAKLSRVFSVSAGQLMGIDYLPPHPKRRRSPKLLRHAERLQGLSQTAQRFVVRIIDHLEEMGRVSKSKPHGSQASRN